MVNDTRAVRQGIGLACMTLTLAILMPSPGAHAQFFWDQPRLSADDAARAVMARGFQVLARPTLNNDVYVAQVVDRRGLRERLIIAADTGQILQRDVVEAGRVARRGDSDIPPGPIPPGTIPNDDRQPGLLSRLFGGDDTSAEERPAPPDQSFVDPDRAFRTQRQRRPRTVERTPDTVQPPDAVDSEPLAPPSRAPRPLAPVRRAPVQAALPPAAATPKVTPAVPAAVVPAPSDKPVRSISSNPLAIPGSREQDEKTAPKPARAVPAEQATVTPPKPQAAVPAKAPAAPKEIVPVAPLD